MQVKHPVNCVARLYRVDTKRKKKVCTRHDKKHSKISLLHNDKILGVDTAY